MILSSQQRKLLDELLPVAKIALSPEVKNLPIRPRTHTLICAPSGAGKSHLMKELGSLLKVPVLLLNVSNWQPLGSRTENYTWTTITDFLEKNDNGIIVLDELDKLRDKNSWNGYVRLEIHDLMDGVIPSSVITDDDDADLW